ncbi:MAG: hypothetical protein ABSD78_16595 [Acidimicrobiales bacterium]
MSDSLPKLLKPRQARQVAIGLAATRIAIGVAAWVTPKLVVRPWVGDVVAEDAGGHVLSRALGGRDVALGAGSLIALRHGGPTRGWIEASALADAGDLLATVAAFKSLPRLTRWGIFGLTLGAVAAGALVSPVIDQTD